MDYGISWGRIRWRGPRLGKHSQAVTDILFCRFIAYTSDYDALKHTVKRAESRLASRSVTKEPTASISGGASPGVNMHR